MQIADDDLFTEVHVTPADEPEANLSFPSLIADILTLGLCLFLAVKLIGKIMTAVCLNEGKALHVSLWLKADTLCMLSHLSG